MKNQDEPVYMKHNVGIGGVYVRVEKKKAHVSVRDLDIDREFTGVARLEDFITELDEKAYQKKCRIVNKMRGSGS
ncbi:MAG: hypothetical protein KGY80_05875 [Candidatus Thorarchaeota archaeon]|nr:hypothetical protein [Candidatus Thorarchaeota archaeon]